MLRLGGLNCKSIISTAWKCYIFSRDVVAFVASMFVVSSIVWSLLLKRKYFGFRDTSRDC